MGRYIVKLFLSSAKTLLFEFTYDAMTKLFGEFIDSHALTYSKKYQVAVCQES